MLGLWMHFVPYWFPSIAYLVFLVSAAILFLAGCLFCCCWSFPEWAFHPRWNALAGGFSLLDGDIPAESSNWMNGCEDDGPLSAGYAFWVPFFLVAFGVQHYRYPTDL